MVETGQGNDIAGMLRQAIALFQQGNAAEAEALVASAQRRNPDDFNVLHVLGSMLVQGRDPARGVTLIRKALALRQDFAPAWNNLGNGYRRLRRSGDALDAYDQAIALQPNFVEAYTNRGNTLVALGRPQDGLADFETAARLAPHMAEAHVCRANILLALERPGEAVAGYDEALARDPRLVSAHNNRGNALHRLGRRREALDSFDTAIRLRPDFAEAYNNRGKVVAELHGPQAALESYDRAIALAPAYAAAHSNRGNILLTLGRPWDALASQDAAIALEPDNFRAHGNRGNALLDLKQLDGALASYDRAIALRPAYAEAHWNRGIALLLQGRMEEGWPEYSFRHRAAFAAPQVHPAERLWTGEQDLKGKTLLLHHEQGMGDTIQFCRYALVAHDRGARVLLSPHKGLERLMTSLGPDIAIVDGAEATFDYHAPLLDMPRACGTRLDTVPWPGPYLAAEPERVAQWREKLAGGGLKVGICWQGNPNTTSDVGRSFPVCLFEGIARIPGVRLIALQKGAGLDQLDNLPGSMCVERLAALDEGSDAFLDTAAVMANLDVVITSDTAVAHLAGALGRPAMVALKYVPDWRWLLDRADTPWYPEMQLFRQQTHGDWSPVFAAIEAKLRTWRA